MESYKDKCTDIANKIKELSELYGEAINPENDQQLNEYIADRIRIWKYDLEGLRSTLDALLIQAKQLGLERKDHGRFTLKAAFVPPKNFNSPRVRRTNRSC
jgi:hypothetical protein